MTNRKMPPHSIDAEQSVLGSLILDNSRFHEVAGVVCAEDFYREDHQIIFGAIAEMSNQHKAVDFVSLMEYMKKAGTLENAGGVPYIGTLANDTASSASVLAHAEIVRERSQMRTIICVCGDAVEQAFKGFDLTEIIQKLGSATTKVLERSTGGAVTFSDAIDAATNDYLAAMQEQTEGRTPGIPMGIPYLDANIGGMRRGESIGICARTSVGKSTLANQIAIHAASKGFAGGYFSLEENPSNFATRAIARQSWVNLGKIRNGAADIENRLMDGINKAGFRQFPLYIESKIFDLPAIVARITFMVRKHGIKFAVIDHIGHVNAKSTKNGKRHEDIGLITRTFKQLAEALSISVVLVCQIGRESEKDGRYPKLSDLRESGDIEQDLNICIAMHPIGETDEKGDQPMAVGILKSRFGRRGWARDRKFMLRGRWQRLDEIEEMPEQDMPPPKPKRGTTTREAYAGRDEG